MREIQITQILIVKYPHFLHLLCFNSSMYKFDKTSARFETLKMNQKLVNFAHCEFLFIWIRIVNFSNRKNWYSREIMEKILLFINFPGFFLSIYLRLWIVFKWMFCSLFTFSHIQVNKPSICLAISNKCWCNQLCLPRTYFYIWWILLPFLELWWGNNRRIGYILNGN